MFLTWLPTCSEPLPMKPFTTLYEFHVNSWTETAVRNKRELEQLESRFDPTSLSHVVVEKNHGSRTFTFNGNVQLLRVWEAAAFLKFQDSWYWGNSSFAATMWYSTRQLLLKASWLTYRQVPPPLWVKKAYRMDKPIWKINIYILFRYNLYIIICECWQCLAEVMILILSLQHIRFSSFWPAVLQMACECLRGLLKPIKSMARFHTTVKCGLILYVIYHRYTTYIYIEREIVSVYYLILLITCDSCQELSTTADHPVATPAHWSWGPVQCFSWQSLPCVNTYGPCGRRNPSARSLARKISQELSAKRTIWIWKLLDAACILFDLACSGCEYLNHSRMCFFNIIYILIFCSGRLMRTMSWKTIT